ncbi:MAG: hypothetical protein ABI114_14605 [Rhodanobacter sp.]
MLKRLMKLISELRALPPLEVNLRCSETAGNNPFFERVVRDFYREAVRRHRKFPVVRNYQYGVTANHLTNDFNDYFKSIESAARRNYKKSCRLGYTFDRIDYNKHLSDITAILRSSQERQGRAMPAALLERGMVAVNNPKSSSPLHDYPYFGILRDNHVYAFAGCLIAGDLCSIETIYGHADHQADGIVPMMIIGIAEWAIKYHPDVKYYSYGTYFGATESMQRFKRKFGFMPHRARWILGD